MSVPRRNLIHTIFGLLVAGVLFSARAHGVQESAPLHHSSDNTKWDRKSNRVELVGHAIVSQPSETLTADYVILNLVDRTIDAKGNCVYISSESVIHGEEMHFNMDTHTGTIIRGKVSNEQFYLTGEKITKMGQGRFQTHESTYSTCLDCPQSWTLKSDDVDMEIDGYAYMTNVSGRIKDSPIFWLPYLVIPLKTRRQSGLLFPKFGLSQGNFTYFQQFFWATSRSTDMTFGLGYRATHGLAADYEGRYSLGPKSGGQLNLWFQKDNQFKLPGVDFFSHNRYALNFTQSQQLPGAIFEKLRFAEVGDNLHPGQLGNVQTFGNPYITSEVIFSHSTDQVSTYLAARRFRSLFSHDVFEFDPTTVQQFPTAVVSSNDKILFGTPFIGGISLGVTNFTRTGGTFDRNLFNAPADYNPANPREATADYSPAVKPGEDPIRKATRFSVFPSLYTTIRPFDVISIVPSVEYRGFYYTFPQPIPDLFRGYGLFQTDVSTQLERVYDYPDPLTPKIKHLFRPFFTYSLIPFSHENFKSLQGYKSSDNGHFHPFLDQINYANINNFTGYNFDSYDIVPLDTPATYQGYYTPLGHSLTFGFITQLIKRSGTLLNPAPSYGPIVELRSSETYNFRELTNRVDRFRPPRPFSQWVNTLSLSFGKWSSGTEYDFVPYQPVGFDSHNFVQGFTYVFERSVHQRLFAFERSVSFRFRRTGTREPTQRQGLEGTINYSINDYFQPRFTFSRNLSASEFVSWTSGLTIQSPAQCWKVDLGLTKAIDKTGLDFLVDMSLNLTGSGFGGVGEVAQVAGVK